MASKSKKDFSNVAAARVLGVAEDAIAPEVIEADDAQENMSEPKKRKPRRTYNAQEAHEYRDMLKTQGRKGASAKRINLAFTDTNYNYVSTMARVRGETLTEFINLVIAESMARNAETYLKAIEFRNSITGSGKL